MLNFVDGMASLVYAPDLTRHAWYFSAETDEYRSELQFGNISQAGWMTRVNEALGSSFTAGPSVTLGSDAVNKSSIIGRFIPQ